MSNRVVAIKILGIGEYGSSQPATFTSRYHPLYGSGLAGTVVSLTDQLSSEIGVFGSLGSDSTTSFTILSTDTTRFYLMSRGKIEVPGYQGQPVRVQNYIPPDPGVITANVTSTANFVIGNNYRIQNTAFECVGIGAGVQLQRTWGCAPVPIAMTSIGPDEVLGSKVYDLNQGVLGGVEQLPVIIETVDLDSTTPEVIFRGFISSVTNDTSAHGDNLIRVSCSSMMAYVKQAPFVPAWGPVNMTLARDNTGGIFTRRESEVTARAEAQTNYDERLYGKLFSNANGYPIGGTVAGLWQIRDAAKGGIAAADLDTNPGYVTISSTYNLSWGSGTTVSDNGYRMYFNDGFYGDGNFGPELQFEADLSTRAEGDRYVHRWSNRVTPQLPTIRGENCLYADSLAQMIYDLLVGTYNTDITFYNGARSSNESAWLPFPSVAIEDLIDLPSLLAMCSGYSSPDVPQVNSQLAVTIGDTYSTLLPYEANSAKTVGDVLEGILKRMGGYMVYDAGRFYFGLWAGARSTPLAVTDAALAEPSIKLTFDRSLCLMRVNTRYAVTLSTDVTVYDVPFNNPDLSTRALGKETSLGHWQIVYEPPDAPEWGATKMVANAFGMLMRYSQSAARVDVSLRDSVADLKVGQEIALTSQYLVNAWGQMGVSALTGYVLKAARSWQTPTTAYTIILPGYLSPTNKVTVWSASAEVFSVVSGDTIAFSYNAFTQPALLALPGAPTTDVTAFQDVYLLNGSYYPVQLLDKYGTYKATGTITNIDVANDQMTITGFGAVATSEDIVVLDAATNFVTPYLVWDAFQADTSAQVAGSQDYARKWVP